MNNHKLIIYAILGIVILLFSSAVIANNKAGEEINWQVISSGGNMNGISTNYGLSGTVAQTAIGSGSSTNYGMSHGFWYASGGITSCCILPMRGDLIGDGVPGEIGIDITDLVFMVNYMFKDGLTPECWPEANVDGLGAEDSIDINDLVYLVNFMFKDGSNPMPCP